MRVEKGLLYTKDHDWVKVEGNVVTVGLADYAQDHLGDIVYADSTKAKEELGWEAKYGIREMCEDSWRWQVNNPNGYED